MDKEFCFFLIHFYTSKRCGCRFKYLFLSRYFWQRAVFVCCVFSVLCSLNRQRLKLFYVFIFGEHNLMLLYTIIFQWDRGGKKIYFRCTQTGERIQLSHHLNRVLCGAWCRKRLMRIAVFSTSRPLCLYYQMVDTDSAATPNVFTIISLSLSILFGIIIL